MRHWLFVLVATLLISTATNAQEAFSKLQEKSIALASEIATINAASLAYFRDNEDAWPSSINDLADDGRYIANGTVSLLGTPYSFSQSGLQLEVTVDAMDSRLARLAANQLANATVSGTNVVVVFSPPYQTEQFEAFLQRKANPDDPSRMTLEVAIDGGEQDITNLRIVDGVDSEVSELQSREGNVQRLETDSILFESGEIAEVGTGLVFSGSEFSISGSASINGSLRLSETDIKNIAKLYAEELSADSFHVDNGQVDRAVGDYVASRTAVIQQLSGKELDYESANITRLEGGTGQSDLVETNSVVAETANITNFYSEELIATAFQSTSGETLRLSVNGMASILDAIMGSLRSLEINVNNWATDQLDAVNYYSDSTTVRQDLTISQKGKINELIMDRFTSDRFEVNNGQADSGTVGNLDVDNVDALSWVLQRLVTNGVKAISSELQRVDASKVAVQGLLSATKLVADSGDIKDLKIGDLTGRGANFNRVSGGRFDGERYNGDDFDIGKTSENEIYNEITEYNNKLYNCMYVTKYCAATAPIIKNTACENCFRKDTISVFNGRAIAKVTECKNGCEYNWIIGNVSGNCSAGSIAKGNTRTVSCEFSKALSEGEKSNTQVSLIARNSMDASKLDKANFQISWERPQPQNPFASMKLQPNCTGDIIEDVTSDGYVCRGGNSRPDIIDAEVEIIELPNPLSEYTYSVSTTIGGPAWECSASATGSTSRPGVSLAVSPMAKVNRCVRGQAEIVWTHKPTGEQKNYLIQVYF